MEKASLPPSHSPGQAAAPVPPGPRLVSILSPTPKLSTPTTQWCLNVPELESAHPSLITSLWTPDTSFPTFLCGTYLCVFFLFFKLDIFFIYILNAIPKAPYALPCPAPQPTQSCCLTLAFPCTGAYALCKTKGLSSGMLLTNDLSSVPRVVCFS